MPKIFSMPKVRISKDTTNVGVHDLSHDVSSTFEFGFCAPQFSKLMMPDSDMDIDVAASIRLMPMPLPTFGRVSMKYYHEFVPMEDLWRPTNQFFAQQYYNPSQGLPTGSTSYVPATVPYLNMRNYKAGGSLYNTLAAPSLLSLVLGGNNCVWSAYDITTGDINSITNKQTIEFKSVPNSTLDSKKISDALGIYTNPLNASTDFGNPSLGLSPYTRDSNQGLFDHFDDYKVNFESCDMYFIISGESSAGLDKDTLNASSASQAEKKPILVCIKFTNNGRRVRKILEGLGIRLDPSYEEPINILPIFAYYKAWYDLMQPSRSVDWEGTAAFRILDHYTQFGDWNILSKYKDPSHIVVNSRSLLDDFAQFFQVDLPGCFATCEPNYVSMQLPTMSLENRGIGLSYQDYDSVIGSNSGSDSERLVSSVDPGAQAYITNSGSGIMSDGIALVQRLSRYITKNSIIGRRIAEFMKVHFNADVDDNTSNFIGKQEVSAQIGDVFATAETEGKDLGQFAGQGYGSTDEVPHFHFHSKVHGYYIVFAAVEPVSNYVQSFEGENLAVHPMEFATPQFDALGYEITPKAEVFTNSDCGYGTFANVRPYDDSTVIPHNLRSSDGFGFVPRYTAQKVMKSKLLGDLSLKSTRDSYLGYTLDNWITTSLINKQTAPNGSEKYEISNVSPNYIVAGSLWRFLGKNGFLNNYNRIFYNTGKTSSGEVPNVFDVIDDNFVVHSAWNVRYKCPLKSLSNSFDTLGDSNETISLTKA